MFKFLNDKILNDKMSKGFTLLEMIMAAFVLTVGITTILTLIHRANVSSQIAASRLTAAYLAQEGLEIVRNIRDSNWLAQSQDPSIVWDRNIGTGDREAGFNDFSLSVYQDRNLRINGGFYNYTSGQSTKFKRRITIVKPNSDLLSVSVQVTWTDRGIPYSISVREDLYNWK